LVADVGVSSYLQQFYESTAAFLVLAPSVFPLMEKY